MPFQDAERVLYERNPLEEVICQLRFPPILKIEAEAPVAFQERVRAAYPFYKAKSALKPLAGFPPELAALVARELPFSAGQTAHEFISQDRNWTLTLTRDFLALTCRQYDRWETFKHWLAGPFQALIDLYSPAFIIRIGLRYRDVIRRSILHLSEVPWAELLQPYVAGPLSEPPVSAEIEHVENELLLRLPESRGFVRVRHGLVRDEKSEEVCYVIDSDFFLEEPKEPLHALSHLDAFNRQARLFFRWCIRERLHNAMRPRPLPRA